MQMQRLSEKRRRGPDRWFARGLALATLGVLLLIPGGCVPLRVPADFQDTSSSPQKVDLKFLKAGVTTREEVVKNLAAIDTHAEKERFFWGRLSVSKWGVVGLPYRKAVGAEREWGAENLLVGYDERGVVDNVALVPDPELLEQLALLNDVAGTPPDFSSPRAVNSVVYWHRMKKAPNGGAREIAPLTLGA